MQEVPYNLLINLIVDLLKESLNEVGGELDDTSSNLCKGIDC